MPRLTKTQNKAIQIIRRRIDVKHESFRGSEEIAKALGNPDVRRYLESWVFPLIDYVELGEQWHGQADSINRGD